MKILKKSLLLSALPVCALAIGFISYTPGGKSSPHLNPVDEKISLYSDRDISPNAITADSRFKDLAFEPAPSRKSFFPTTQIAAGIGSLMSFAGDIFGFGKKEPAIRENGSWIWTPVPQMTPEYIESVLAGAQMNGVDVMYVSIDSYLDIFVMEDGAEKQQREKEFSMILEDFIKSAEARGIKVDAEAGWRNWAEEDNVYKAFAVVNYVKNFNTDHEFKFRGFQYDIEPYLLDSYKTEPAPVLKDFVKLVDETETFLGASGLRFSIVVPDFYDKKDEVTPKFAYNGRKDYAFGHILNILDRRPDSSIIIMSYRNFAEGKDGSIEISMNEMRTAKRAHNTKVIIAQETGEFLPPYITFHNTSKQHLAEQTIKIKAAFESYPVFGGLAMHYVNSLIALE